MTSRDFCYWIQGYFELQDRSPTGAVEAMGASQVSAIRKHLALVFKHEIDPSAGGPAHQAELDEIHEGSTSTKPPKIGGVGPDGTVYRC